MVCILEFAADEVETRSQPTIQSKIPRLRVPASASSVRPRARRNGCARGPVNAHTCATSEDRGCRRQSLKDQDGRRCSGSAVRLPKIFNSPSERSMRSWRRVTRSPALVPSRLRRARGRSPEADPVHNRHGLFARELPRKFEYRRGLRIPKQASSAFSRLCRRSRP